MPIYAYRCELCGHQQDSLQKLADPHLTLCPACNKDGLKRQLTAAGFQLKGSGWYVTDFKDGGKKPADAGAPAAAAAASKDASTSTSGAPSPAPAAAPAPSAAPTPASSPSPAPKSTGSTGNT